MKEFYHVLLQCQQKNEKAIRQLLNDFRSTIKKYSYQCEDSSVIQDLETFLIKVVTHLELEKFSSKNMVMAYLHKALRNEYLRIRRKKQIQPQKELCYDDQILSIQKDIISLEECLELKEAILKLKSEQKSVIILKFIMGYQESEIAEELHITRQGVNKIKQRAFAEIKKYYKK